VRACVHACVRACVRACVGQAGLEILGGFWSARGAQGVGGAQAGGARAQRACAGAVRGAPPYPPPSLPPPREELGRRQPLLVIPQPPNSKFLTQTDLDLPSLIILVHGRHNGLPWDEVPALGILHLPAWRFVGGLMKSC